MAIDNPGQGNRRFKPTVTALALLSLICLLPALLGTDAEDWLRYDRDKILDGQIWRLWSAHFIHLGWSHLGMNLAGLWLIGLLYGYLLNWPGWLLVNTCSALAISLMFLFFNPELIWYVGLSGVLHTLIVTGILLQLRSQPLWGEWALLLLLCGKLLWEQRYGSLPGSAELAGGPVIVDAHLYGALIGLALGLMISPISHHRPPMSSTNPKHQEIDS